MYIFCLFIVFRCDCNSKFTSRSVWKPEECKYHHLLLDCASPEYCVVAQFLFFMRQMNNIIFIPQYSIRISYQSSGRHMGRTVAMTMYWLIDTSWHGWKRRYWRPLPPTRGLFPLIKGIRFGLIQAFFLELPPLIRDGAYVSRTLCSALSWSEVRRNMLDLTVSNRPRKVRKNVPSNERLTFKDKRKDKGHN